MKTNKTWKLPKPVEVDGKYEWRPVVRVGTHVPFGYKQDPDDQDILLPIPEELELFEKAKKFLKQYSYREVANWLTKETGRYISHTGLRKRIEVDKRRKRTITIKRKFAKRLEKAINEIKKLEEDSLDCFTLKDNARA